MVFCSLSVLSIASPVIAETRYKAFSTSKYVDTISFTPLTAKFIIAYAPAYRDRVAKALLNLDVHEFADFFAASFCSFIWLLASFFCSLFMYENVDLPLALASSNTFNIAAFFFFSSCSINAVISFSCLFLFCASFSDSSAFCLSTFLASSTCSLPSFSSIPFNWFAYFS